MLHSTATVAAFCALLVALGGASHPVRSATLTGTVKDANQAPVPGAEVGLPLLSKYATTDDSGGYRIADVPAGVHTLRVRRVGFLEYTGVVDVPASGSVERNVGAPRPSWES